MDTYPLRDLIRPRCAERAKPGRGKPVLIMHIGFLACFHAISLERSRFSKIATEFVLSYNGNFIPMPELLVGHTPLKSCSAFTCMCMRNWRRVRNERTGYILGGLGRYSEELLILKLFLVFQSVQSSSGELLHVKC